MTPRLLVIAIAIVLSTTPPAHAGPNEDANALFAQGMKLEKVGEWANARAVYVKLQAIKGYEGQALYRQAVAAFNANDNDDAIVLAQKTVQVGGPFKLQAKFLYADALFRTGQYARARDLYTVLRNSTTGDFKIAAEKKIAAAERALGVATTSAPTPAPTPAPAPAAPPPKSTASGDELYKQAIAAFQKDDLAAALPLAIKAAQADNGSHKTDARVLFGDILFRQGEFLQAKDVFLLLRGMTKGDVRAIVTKKIAATNRQLKLPETDGLTD